MSTSVTDANTPYFIELIRNQAWYRRIGGFLVRLFNPFVNEREAKRIIKYGLVGVSGTIIELGLLNLFIFGLGWSSDWQKIAANVIAVSLAIVNNFVWNRLWTFPEARSGSRVRQFVKFVSVAGVGILLNSAIFFAAYKFLFSAFLPDVVSVQLAKFAATGLVLFWNFAANRFWTFRHKPL
ncbi:MAG: GtrA family protein [Chloroflexi bacterium]|nr:MAG: GtrA family protein [Chloroflexota bacterium]